MRVQLDPVFFVDSQTQLQCVNGVQAQTVAEQRLVGRYILRGYILEVQGLDNQRFDLVY